VKQKLGESYYRVQTYYSAYAEFKKILEVYPTDPAANFMLGITAYKQAVLGELIEAFLEMFDPSLAEEQRQRSKAGANVRERAEVYREMARAFYTAQKASPGFLEATFNLALTYNEMNQLDSAEVYYKKSIQIQPDLIRAHIKLAKLYEDRGEKEKSLAKYKEVVQIDPAYFATHPTLGAFHNYINIIDVVLEELDETLKSNPNDLSANLTLAKIYYAQGFHGKAANVFRKVLTINPNEPEAKKMLAQMERR
jgi:tetratricopeptide (TPR) repeat protein